MKIKLRLPARLLLGKTERLLELLSYSLSMKVSVNNTFSNLSSSSLKIPCDLDCAI